MSNDYISKRAVIDRINKQREHLHPDIYPQDKIGDAAYRICVEFIERLSFAQPELSDKEKCLGSYAKAIDKVIASRVADAVDTMQ